MIYAQDSFEPSTSQAAIPPLPFGKGDIVGMHVTSGGVLVFALEDGRSVGVDGFEEMASRGETLILGDGTTYQARELFTNLASDMPSVVIEKPAPGEIVAYEITPGQKYMMTFDPRGAKTDFRGNGAFLITFDDEGQIILAGFQDAMDAAVPAQIGYEPGAFLSLQDFSGILGIAQGVVPATFAERSAEETVDEAQTTIRSQQMEDAKLAAIAQQLAAVEPAAGGTAGAAGGRGGFGFESSVEAAPLDSPAAVGPIAPTALQYGIPTVLDEVLPQEPLARAAAPVPEPPGRRRVTASALASRPVPTTHPQVSS